MDSKSDKPDQLESALRSLSPRKSAIDRDRLLYLAGQASASASVGAQPLEVRAGRFSIWRVLTCASSVAAVVLAAVLFVRGTPEPVVIEKIVYVNRPSADVAEPKTGRKPKPAPQLVRQPGDNRGLKPAVEPGSGFWRGTEFVSARTLRLRHPALSLDVDQLPATDSSYAESPSADFNDPMNTLRGTRLPLRQQKSEPKPAVPFFGSGRFPFQFSWGKSDEL